MDLDRRLFIKKVMISGVMMYVSACSSSSLKHLLAPVPPYRKISSLDKKNFLPIEEQIDISNQKEFSGDRPHFAHEVLWNKNHFLRKVGGIPAPTEQAKVVIIGGGMAGLATAFELKNLKPIILEQASQFGGNSRGESWRGIEYSIGAAYVNTPDEGSEVDDFLKRIDAYSAFKVKTAEDPVEINGVKIDNLWEDESHPAHSQLKRIKEIMQNIYNGRAGERYPEVPALNDIDREFTNQLDQMNFKDYMENRLGEALHPMVYTLLEQYSWSSFDASITEISAATGVNFYSADFGNTMVAPGGNAWITNRLVNLLADELGDGYLRTNALVANVSVRNGKSYVTYINESRLPVTIEADRVVMACPKFVVAKILEDIEPERLAIIGELKYRSYLVANVFIDGKSDFNFYDMYLLQNGQTDKDTDMGRSTDAIWAGFASHNNATNTVLTLYRGIPYDGARGRLYSNGAFHLYKNEFTLEVKETILPLLNIKEERLLGLRITRWGHPMPVSMQGLIQSGKVDWLRKPFREIVYFVEQDNWMCPCFETAVEEALYWSKRIKQSLT